MRDLRILPKVHDSWSYLYVEHGRIEQDDKAIALHDAKGKVPIPAAALTLLMLGPGTTVTHAAMKTLTECGCTALWTGEHGVRLYAVGLGETRSAARLLHQARKWASLEARLGVVMRMYRMRFAEDLDPSATLRQIRGMEGVRVRQAYAEASQRTGVPWHGRDYQRDRWLAADPINRALSAANSCLYGICHAAILSVGYSPAIGFVHTGKMLSFVYDVADLYKTELTIPVAFEATAVSPANLDSRVRLLHRDKFAESRLLGRIVDDLDAVMEYQPGANEEAGALDQDAAAPSQLWDPVTGRVAGGRSHDED
jgi:CRISPR-associated protein Cas1